MLFAERPKDSMPDAPDSLAIDESFYKFSLKGFGPTDHRPLFLSALLDRSRGFGRMRKAKRRLPPEKRAGDEADLRASSLKVHNALIGEPRGQQISRAALVRAGITADEAANAHKLELARIIQLEDALPGMPLPLVEQRTSAIASHNQLAKRLADFWDLIRRTLERDDIERSLWLRVEDTIDPDSKTGQRRPAIYLRWRKPIHPDWSGIPTVIVDATLSEPITRVFYAGAKIIPAGQVKLPHVRVRQVPDRTFSAAMMIPRGGDPNDPHEKARLNNVRLVRDYIQVKAAQVAPGRVLVICQKQLESVLKAGPLPDTVDLGHFQALAGLNQWRDARVIIIIGRTLPPVRDVEQIARVVFEREITEIEPNQLGRVEYPRVPRSIRMRGGGCVMVDGPGHPDPLAEEIRLQICEAELVQAIGRGRGIRRQADNALEVDLLTNIAVPGIEVDEALTWQEIQPSSIDVMWAAGAVPLGHADMATAYPHLFVSAEAARKRLEREKDSSGGCKNPGQFRCPEARNPGQTSIRKIIINRHLSGVSGVFAVHYRRSGSRGPAGELLYDPARIDPLGWLTERLGPVALIGPAVPAAGSKPAEISAAGLAEAAPVSAAAKPSFPRGLAWLALRLGRVDLVADLAIRRSELVPPAFPVGFVEHTIQTRRSRPSRVPAS
jgi:putative DNA primase/helicase